MDVTSVNQATASAQKEFKAFGEDGFSFWDALDMINPLQHIPVVNAIYRQLTGDQIDPGAKIAGGTLFGGPIGAVASIADVMIEHNTGKDMGEHAFALLEEFGGEDQEPVMVAEQAGTKDKTLEEILAGGSDEASPPEASFVTASGGEGGDTLIPLQANAFAGLRVAEPAPLAQQASFTHDPTLLRSSRDGISRAPIQSSPVPAPGAIAQVPQAEYDPQKVAAARTVLFNAQHEANAFAAIRAGDGTSATEQVKAASTAAPPAVADAFAGMRQDRDTPVKRVSAAAPGQPKEMPSWFTDKMAEGLAKYHSSTQTSVAPTRKTTI